MTAGLTEFECVLSGSALSPAHVRHDQERVGANRGTHRVEGQCLDCDLVPLPDILIISGPGRQKKPSAAFLFGFFFFFFKC